MRPTPPWTGGVRAALVTLFAATLAPAGGVLAAATPPADAADAQARLDAKIADEAAGKRPEVSIPFADHGGIRNWRTLGRDALLIEGSHGKWYRVELMSGCFDLPFADRVGFRSNPAGDFDRFSSVFVRGQRCTVKSVTESAPPPKPMKKAAKAKSGDADVAPR
jgi:hypothetical protein